MFLPLTTMKQDFLELDAMHQMYEGTWYGKDFLFMCDAIRDNLTMQFLDWENQTECVYRIELSRVLTMTYSNFIKFIDAVIYYNSIPLEVDENVCV